VIGVILTAPAPGRGQTRPAATLTLQGAGATFPAPLYRRWISVYTTEHPEVAIDYKDVGSGEGVKRFVAASVDFAASDGAMSDEQMSQVNAGVRLVPATAGMVVLAYNLPGLGGELKLSRDVYLDIFDGTIVKWNDPRIRTANPGLTLPNRSIVIVARQDSSGTTFALTNHLSTISAPWRNVGPGVGYLVDWSRRATLARGNEGVAARVKISEGAIGYVEYGFARRLGLPMASLQNRAGRYVAPASPAGQAALASNVKSMPPNLRLFLPDPEGVDAYPIVTFSWLLLQDRYPDAQRTAVLKKFVAWCLTDGQGLSRELGYIPLPAEVASISLAAVDRVE